MRHEDDASMASQGEVVAPAQAETEGHESSQ